MRMLPPAVPPQEPQRLPLPQQHRRTVPCLKLLKAAPTGWWGPLSFAGSGKGWWFGPEGALSSASGLRIVEGWGGWACGDSVWFWVGLECWWLAGCQGRRRLLLPIRCRASIGLFGLTVRTPCRRLTSSLQSRRESGIAIRLRSSCRSGRCPPGTYRRRVRVQYYYGLFLQGSNLYRHTTYLPEAGPGADQKVGTGWTSFKSIATSNYSVAQPRHAYLYGLNTNGSLYRYAMIGAGFKSLGSFPGSGVQDDDRDQRDRDV